MMNTRPLHMAITLMGALALAACDDGASQGNLDGETTSSAAKDAVVLLLDHGLRLNGGTQAEFDFGADASAVRAALDPVLGEPIDVFEQPRCEPGTLTLVEYPGRLTVNMQEGKLIGWFVDLEGDPKYATPEGVRVGTPREALDDAYFTMRSGTSPFGAEYSTVGGYVFSVAASLRPEEAEQGQKVQTMDAGEVCFR